MKKYESFPDDIVETMLEDINVGYETILEDYPYGNFELDLKIENDSVLIHLRDEENDGYALFLTTIKDFVTKINDGELENLLNNVIYYNYFENENDI